MPPLSIIRLKRKKQNQSKGKTKRRKWNVLIPNWYGQVKVNKEDMGWRSTGSSRHQNDVLHVTCRLIFSRFIVFCPLDFHKSVQPSLLSHTSPTSTQNFRGFMNLFGIILVIMNARLVVENFVKYGWLLKVNVESFLTTWDETWPGAMAAIGKKPLKRCDWLFAHRHMLISLLLIDFWDICSIDHHMSHRIAHSRSTSCSQSISFSYHWHLAYHSYRMCLSDPTNHYHLCTYVVIIRLYLDSYYVDIIDEISIICTCL